MVKTHSQVKLHQKPNYFYDPSIEDISRKYGFQVRVPQAADVTRPSFEAEFKRESVEARSKSYHKLNSKPLRDHNLLNN